MIAYVLREGEREKVISLDPPPGNAQKVDSKDNKVVAKNRGRRILPPAPLYLVSSDVSQTEKVPDDKFLFSFFSSIFSLRKYGPSIPVKNFTQCEIALELYLPSSSTVVRV